jgi:sec-independent protein translocase protein TatB
VFGVGLPEFAVIALVAVFVFGPDRLPDLARQAGRMVRQVRRLANNARDELRHIAEALEDDPEEPRRPTRRGQRPLGAGEVPPYDADAT